nr:hypothetical protein [Tanacetum cinerariifolium]
MVAFTVNIYHDGMFIENPLQYIHGSFRVVKDVNIEGKTDSDESSDEPFDKLEDVKDLDDFQNKGEDMVDTPKLITDDPWLNKLVGKGNFIGHMDDLTPNLNGRFNVEVDDP